MYVTAVHHAVRLPVLVRVHPVPPGRLVPPDRKVLLGRRDRKAFKGYPVPQALLAHRVPWGRRVQSELPVQREQPELLVPLVPLVPRDHRVYKEYPVPQVRPDPPVRPD